MPKTPTQHHVRRQPKMEAALRLGTGRHESALVLGDPSYNDHVLKPFLHMQHVGTDRHPMQSVRPVPAPAMPPGPCPPSEHRWLGGSGQEEEAAEGSTTFSLML